MSAILGLVGCESEQVKVEQVKAVSATELRNALEDVVGGDIEVFFQTSGHHASMDSIVWDTGENCGIIHAEFNNETLARRIFEDNYNEWEEADGRRMLDENMGYVIFETSDEELIDVYRNNPIEVDTILYASYYYNNMILTIRSSDNGIDKALELIEVLGLPSLYS